MKDHFYFRTTFSETWHFIYIPLTQLPTMDQPFFNSFTMYWLSGEFSPLIWSACSLTTVDDVAILTLLSFIYKRLEKARSVIFGELETVTPEQNEQIRFREATQTQFWPLVTKTTWQTVQKQHWQIQQFQTLFLLFSISCNPVVIHFTMYKLFKKFMHLPDSPDPSVGYSDIAAGNQKYIP